MLGNDIIDITEARRTSNWQRKGFLDKVFSSHEQKEIEESLNPFYLVWRLWSMKESAYKVSIQSGLERSFNPSSIQCTIISSEVGLISIGGLSLYSETKVSEDYILSLVNTINTAKITTKVLKIPAQNLHMQKEVLHQQILGKVSTEYNYDKDDLSIQKTNLNVPYISHKNKKIASHISISHHGKFAVFSLNSNLNSKK